MPSASGGPGEAGRAVRGVGIVVIGRNEGERLLACLRSLRPSGCPVVYVDSGSQDDSAVRASALCESVLALDPTLPFSAARARNEGMAALAATHPDVEQVQFVDGDCTLLEGWLEVASATLRNDPGCAVVIGPLQERHPDASPYNRLCALEWLSPPGELADFGALGGIMLVRRSAFDSVGGFNASVVAGEDSEFGVRARSAGHTIRKIEVPMATHDANILRFGQWWRRSVRSGHAIGQRFALNGRGPLRDCARQRRSLLFWGLALPATIVLLAPPTRGLSLLGLGAYVLLAWRVARHRAARGDSASDARLYARFVVIGKFAEAWGLLRFHLNRIRGRYRILEYK